MKFARLAPAVLFLLPLAPSQARAQIAAEAHGAAPPANNLPQVTFTFDRPGLAVPNFTLRIAEDGSGTYRGNEVLQVRGGQTSPPPQPFNTSFAVSGATAARILALSRETHLFNVACGTRAKNIADTGKKTLTYAAPDGAGSCAYNYSDNKNVTALTEMFEGLAETMDEGRRLDFMHRFDRLGLDAELTNFTHQVSDGRALELVTIAPSLRALADDTEVLQRVRQKANALLAQIPGSPAQP